MQTMFEWGRLQMKARDKPGFERRKFNKRHSWGFRSISTKHSGVSPDGLTDIRSRRPKKPKWRDRQMGRWAWHILHFGLYHSSLLLLCIIDRTCVSAICSSSAFTLLCHQEEKKKKLWPVHSTENRLSITLETEFNKLIKRGATLRSQLSHDDYQINYGTKKLLSPLVSNNYLNHYTKLLKYNICWTRSTSESKYSIKQFHNENGYFLFCAQKTNISIINTNHQIVTIVQ